MEIEELGHVVLTVTDLEQSERFYAEVLGLRVAARMDAPPTVFFAIRNHHDFAISELGPDAVAAVANSPGLAHVAFKVGDSTDDLRRVKAELDALGVAIVFSADHTVSQSLYVEDPDGHWIELYVDVSDVWRTDPQTIATVAPMEL